MPMWRCPHCGTPQAESAKCWVCRRSSTTCSTCRHFRQSLAPSVGFCGLDKRRLPLTGRELRGCWTARAPGGDAEEPRPVPAPDPGIRLRGFVPVEQVIRSEMPAVPNVPATPSAPEALPAVTLDAGEAWANRATLFGDAEG
jgi:hypothetical protein